MKMINFGYLSWISSVDNNEEKYGCTRYLFVS